MLKALLDLLRGYTRSFNNYELCIINALAANLTDDAARKILQRANAINRVQRLDGAREVIGYQMSGRRVLFPEETRLHVPDDIELIAKFRIRSRDQMSALSGRIYVCKGNLASLEFSKPTEHAEAELVDSIEIALVPTADHLGKHSAQSQ